MQSSSDWVAVNIFRPIFSFKHKVSQVGCTAMFKFEQAFGLCCEYYSLKS